MEHQEWLTLRAMAIWGGGFINELARAYRAADSDNQRKIREAWPEDWARYSELGQKLSKEIEKEEA